MNWILAIVAALPIVAVGVLMVVFSWPAKRAMPVGWLAAAIIAALGWNMEVRWLAAATLGGFINAVDILIIVFGALLKPVPCDDYRRGAYRRGGRHKST